MRNRTYGLQGQVDGFQFEFYSVLIRKRKLKCTARPRKGAPSSARRRRGPLPPARRNGAPPAEPFEGGPAGGAGGGELRRASQAETRWYLEVSLYKTLGRSRGERGAWGDVRGLRRGSGDVQIPCCGWLRRGLGRQPSRRRRRSRAQRPRSRRGCPWAGRKR